MRDLRIIIDEDGECSVFFQGQEWESSMYVYFAAIQQADITLNWIIEEDRLRPKEPTGWVEKIVTGAPLERVSSG